MSIVEPGVDENPVELLALDEAMKSLEEKIPGLKVIGESKLPKIEPPKKEEKKEEKKPVSKEDQLKAKEAALNKKEQELNAKEDECQGDDDAW